MALTPSVLTVGVSVGPVTWVTPTGYARSPKDSRTVATDVVGSMLFAIGIIVSAIMDSRVTPTLSAKSFVSSYWLVVSFVADL